MITTIVFDIGGVFFHTPEQRMQGFWGRLGLGDPAVADDLMHGSEMWNVYKRGGMTEEAYWTALMEQLPMELHGSWETLCRAYEQEVVVDEELVRLARVLKAGYHIHALSNAGAELERRLQAFGIEELFGEVINSHRVNMAKPDEEIYQYTCERIGAQPDEILFVDDKFRNTRVADALGWHTHVYTTVSMFRRFLVEANIQIPQSELA